MAEKKPSDVKPLPDTKTEVRDLPQADAPPAPTPEKRLGEFELRLIRNASNQVLRDWIATKAKDAAAGNVIAQLWIDAARKEHVEIRGIPLPEELVAPVDTPAS